jgi:hypothetical protein
MAFWTDVNTEPKRAYRWVLLIGGIPQWICKKVNKPSFTVSETAHKYINHSFYYPGRVEWETTSITLVDPVSPDASKTMEEIIRAAGYHFPEDPNDVSTISKKNAVLSLGNVVIKQVGPDGPETIEEWELINAWVKSVKFGELDYESDDMVNIDLELRYDFAKLTKSGTPVPIAKK